eukprot:gene10982-12145_t
MLLTKFVDSSPFLSKAEQGFDVLHSTRMENRARTAPGELNKRIASQEILPDRTDGKQQWRDGSLYTGSFKNGLRHGNGESKWPNGESYVGEFVRDRREGKGFYIWSDGSKYEGYFKRNKRAGYGKFLLANGNYFEGIYAHDQRDGPGVFTYKDEGLQDIGIWKAKKIVKICPKLKNAFTFRNFTQHSINSNDKEDQDEIVNVDNKKKKKKKETSEIVQLSCNLSEEDELVMPESFKYKDIVNCKREGFKAKGPLENMSERMIYAASEGDVVTVEEILRECNVHPDVTDRTGFGALLAAAVNCHIHVINCLLDYGGNVNGLNEEGLSALAACHILLYTNQDFVDNIAENVPKENSFNSIEWDKQRGCYVHRNDRKTILSMYGLLRSVSGSSGRNRQKISQGSTPGSLFDNKLIVKIGDQIDDHDNDCNDGDSSQQGSGDEDGEDHGMTENWKLTYYQRTLGRREELAEINRCFQKLKSAPFDDREVLDDTRLPPLTFLKAEEVAKEIEAFKKKRKSEVKNKEQVEECGEDVFDKLSHASVYRGVSFGGAPKISMACEDTKQKLLNAERKPHLNATINMLLQRGADPNASSLPMPVLFFAVKSADTKAVKALLSKKADTSIRLDRKHLGLAPLHIAVALPCSEGIEITRLLLEANADPDITDELFGEEERGRTALHIACAREDCDKDAQKVVEYLVKFGANPNTLCRGHSPLSLAISSGNDLVVDTLLKNNADPSMKLTNGVGSALCAATTFVAERRRKPNSRVKLIDKLVKTGADLLAPILIMDKYPPGTVVDYAHHVFNQDRRIAHTPYHALSALERACHNTRKEVLEHLGNLLRTAALKREKEMLENELSNIPEAETASEAECKHDATVVSFDETTTTTDKKGASKKLTAKEKKKIVQQSKSPRRDPNCGLPFSVVKSNDPKTIAALEMNAANQRRLEAKRRFRYCYECGRLIGIRLAACTRCKEVFYCSKNCKVKAWNLRHKDECARLSGRRGNGNRAISPTPVTEEGPELPIIDLRNSPKEDLETRSNESRKNNKLAAKREVSASSRAVSMKQPSLDQTFSTLNAPSREGRKLSAFSKLSAMM